MASAAISSNDSPKADTASAPAAPAIPASACVLCKVQGETLVVYGDDDKPISSWSEFVHGARAALERRRAVFGYRVGYKDWELDNLLDDIRDFADLWQKRKAQDVTFQAVPSHLTVHSGLPTTEGVVRQVIEHLLLSQGGAGGGPGEPDLIAAMVRRVLAEQEGAIGHYPVFHVPERSAALVVAMVQGAVEAPNPHSRTPHDAGSVPTLIAAALEWLDRGGSGATKEQLVAAFVARRPPPDGCPPDACHQFWTGGACAYPQC